MGVREGRVGSEGGEGGERRRGGWLRDRKGGWGARQGRVREGRTVENGEEEE